MYSLKFSLLFAVIGAIQGNIFPDKEAIVSDTRSNYITYRLYNRNVRGVVYTSDDQDIDALEYDVPTVILIHGEDGSYRDDFSTSLRLRFYDNHNVNLFSMDWEHLAADQTNIFDNMKLAASDLVKFLLKLRNNIDEGTNYENGVHLIGFGIGAHLAGNAGSPLSLFWPIARITGLDPTGGEMFGPYSCHLSHRDALYVEVIHTNGPVSNTVSRELTFTETTHDILSETTAETIPETTAETLPESTTEILSETTAQTLPESTTEILPETTAETTTVAATTTIKPPNYIGIGKRIGDVDFFVNGGNVQPGCEDNRCSHRRSWELYALSLKYNIFLGFRCTNMDQMINDECSGLPLLMGGVELVKVPVLPGIYRMNSPIIT